MSWMKWLLIRALDTYFWHKYHRKVIHMASNAHSSLLEKKYTDCKQTASSRYRLAIFSNAGYHNNNEAST